MGKKMPPERESEREKAIVSEGQKSSDLCEQCIL